MWFISCLIPYIFVQWWKTLEGNFLGPKNFTGVKKKKKEKMKCKKREKGTPGKKFEGEIQWGEIIEGEYTGASFPLFYAIRGNHCEPL